MGGFRASFSAFVVLTLLNVPKVYGKAHTFGRNAYSVVDVTDTVRQLKGGRNLHRFW